MVRPPYSPEPPVFSTPIELSQNPFYIHPSENPALPLVNPVLDGKNYHSWSRSMKKAIIMKNKLRFLDGSSPMPADFDPNYEAWMRCNNLVLSWIQNSVSSSISQSIAYYDIAALAWNDLKARFSRADRVRVASLQRDLYAFRQDSLSVNDYFTKLRGLWEELELFRPVPNCTCLARCQCESLRNARKFKREDLVLLFLTGLNDHYAIVRSQILLMEPFPEINAAFSMIVQHESVNGLDSIVVDPTVSLNVAAGKQSHFQGKGKFPSNSGNKDKQCTYCGKGGHTVDICYRKNGYPPGFKFRDGSVPPKHAMANYVASADKPQDSYSASSTVMGLSAEELQALRTLLQVNGSKAQAAPKINQFTTKPTLEPSSSYSFEESRGTAYVSCNSISDSIDMWIIDSGATDHACYSLSLFSKYRRVKPIPVKMPNGSMAQTDIVGEIIITDLITITNVLYLPHFKYNLLSVSRVTKDLHCTFAFADNVCIIQNYQQKMIGSGRLINGLYYLEGIPSSVSLSSPNVSGIVCTSVSIPQSALWHFRLGHASNSRLQIMQQMYPSIVLNKECVCDVCHLAKQKHLSYPLSHSHASKCLELLHMDIWGPYTTATMHGHKYFLTIVDDYSRFTWVILLKGKNEVTSQVQNFITMVETQFESKVKILRSDNGPEFSLASFYASKGIVHQTSCVYTPQQNGRVERKHQCILNIARALLIQSKLPPKFWGYAVLHSVYLMNRMPSMAIKGQLPYQLLFKELPDLSMLKVFGCLCYTSTHEAKRTKLDHRSFKCVFLGYKAGMKGFTVLALHNGALLTSRHVQFEELIFPYSSTNPPWDYIQTAPSSRLASTPLVCDDTIDSNIITTTPSLPVEQVTASSSLDLPVEAFSCSNQTVL
jgi:transposase InsO family protein